MKPGSLVGGHQWQEVGCFSKLVPTTSLHSVIAQKTIIYKFLYAKFDKHTKLSEFYITMFSLNSTDWLVFVMEMYC
jgi:hypothetical protein